MKCRTWLMVLGASCFGAGGALAQSPLNMAVAAQVDERPEHYADIWGYSAPDGRELAILGTARGTAFYDVTNPEAPTAVGFIAGVQSPWRDMKTYEHYCYSVSEGTGEGMQVIDLADPAEPRLVNTVRGQLSSSHNIFVDEDAGRAYLPGANLGMAIYDLRANPINPPLLAVYTQRYVHDAYVRDSIGYLACYNDKLVAIVDFTDPERPREIATLRYPGAASHNTWLSEDGTVLVTTDEVSGGHLNIFDVTDPEHPVHVGSYQGDASASVHNAFIRGSLCYMSYYTSGVHIISIADPANPERVGVYDTYPGTGLFDGAWGVYPFGRDRSIVLASDIVGGLFVLRFYDPTRGVQIAHEPVPDTGDPSRPHLVEARIFSNHTDVDPGSARVLYSVNGEAAADLPMVAGEDDVFSVTIPPVPAGSVVRYAVEAADTAGNVATIPADGHRHIFVVGQTEAFLSFDMEDDNDGWRLAGGTASRGQWERGAPVGVGYTDASGFVWVVPPEDHSAAGERAWVTGLETGELLGFADVDDGDSILESPLLDPGPRDFVRLSYWLWYTNAVDGAGDDVFEAQLSGDDGVTWMVADALRTPSGGWQERTINLENFVDTSHPFRVRFVVSDVEGQSLVEAKLDDVSLVGLRRSPNPRQRLVLSHTPNPVRSTAEIHYRLEASSLATLYVYDGLGRLVRTLERASQRGDNRLTWDGRRYNGRLVPSGVYFYRLEAAGTTETAKLVVHR